jgi:hypothetical protein
MPNNQRAVRVLCESSKEYFKEAYVTVEKFIFLLRSNHEFLADVVLQLGNYIKGMPTVCESLLESIVYFFFDDYGSPAHSLYDYHRFVYTIIDVLSLLRDRKQRTPRIPSRPMRAVYYFAVLSLPSPVDVRSPST